MPYRTVVGETGVLVYMTALSPGAEELGRRSENSVPHNGSIFFILFFLTFQGMEESGSGREVGLHFGLECSRKAELYPNHHWFFFIVM